MYVDWLEIKCSLIWTWNIWVYISQNFPPACAATTNEQKSACSGGWR
jgi:hypothetical protein